MQRVVVIGSSLSGGMAACYLKLHQPELEVVTIQKPRASFPIVGESLTEFSTQTLHELGLAAHLEERQLHKYGLTFYFKEKIDDPTDFTYATHEANRIPPMPSNQVNRFTLAKRLRERAAELGVVSIDGVARDVTIGDDGRHEVVYTREDGSRASIDARFIVDASGRRRFLADKLGLKRPAPYQRSSFWFRLEGFDRSILKQMVEVKTPHHCFDPYYVTHHFFGRHNWIWAIPLRPESSDGQDLISIGIVFRPDLYGREVTTVEAFLSCVGAEHPVLTRLIESGRIVDTNVYRNYFYETAQSYSSRGWFIVGDAGFTVDPLYSTGIAMTSIQVRQVAALIAAQRAGQVDEGYVADLDKLYRTTRQSLQYEVSTLYEVIADPFQAHLRMHCASAFYFYVLLPFWLNGYITDPVGARVATRFLEHGAKRAESLRALLAVASRRGGALPIEQVRNWYTKTVNWRLRGPAEANMPGDVARCLTFFARTRFQALRRAAWQGWPLHLWLCAADLGLAFVFGVLLRGRRIKDLRVVRWIVGAPAPAAVYTRPPAAAGVTAAVERKSTRNPVRPPVLPAIGRTGDTTAITNPGGPLS